jgi:23S rRNA (cytidine1920-2'-O)/16S rRNA (cytidine1409-2'-O)-methyltransferase
MSGRRLDQELVKRGLFGTRNSARNAIRAGFITVDGFVDYKPARSVKANTDLAVSATAGNYVGRGAHKLLAALDAFRIETAGKRAIDVGSSTGGFTQVLLESGVGEVVALDVGRNQLNPLLRADTRVTVRESTNVRDIAVHEAGGPFDVVTADLSFISLRTVAADLERLGDVDADWVVLVKPQFEVGRQGLSKDGLVLSEEARGNAMLEVIDAFHLVGLTAVGAARSPFVGGSGNYEALLWLRRGGAPILSAEAFKVLTDE